MARSLALALLVAAGFATVCGAAAVAAQDTVTFDVAIEPARATVGEHLTLTVVARHPANVSVSVPDAADQFAPLELVEVVPPESRDAGSNERETRFVYVLAAFETGETHVAPLSVTLRGATETTAVLQLPGVMIESVLPEDGAEFRDLDGPLAGQVGTPTWVWAALAMAGFVGLTVITMALARVPVTFSPPPIPTRPAPPGDSVRKELDAIATAGLLAGGALKEYYARIATCLRRYLAARFGAPAVAMTPQELEERLVEQGADPWPVRLAANLLRQAEAVQFAQYEPARERAEADLAAAYEIVELTQAPEPQEMEKEASVT